LPGNVGRKFDHIRTVFRRDFGRGGPCVRERRGCAGAGNANPFGPPAPARAEPDAL
jgi:hypothetical protein